MFMKKLLDKSLIKRGASLFSVNEEILQALHDEKPVVALESTIITHGMRFPHNYQTAKEVEDVVRQQNAVPATIAVIKGQIKVGLSNSELEELSRKQGTCCKISRRDFPHVVSRKLSGGTTVSGTMIVAQKVGIPIFVTGGVGGVHREGEVTMDVSADLTELGKTSVAVISSGVKSILDIPKTLEYLETQGVAVASYGPSTDFPAFYCRKSGHKSPYNLKSCKEAAEFIKSAIELNLGSGVLIAVPIPEKYSLDENAVEEAIERGLKEAKEMNVNGKDVTPFLLNRISEITQGKSLQSNMALIKNNAFVGAEIAVELSKLQKDSDKSSDNLIFDFAKLGSSAVPDGMTKSENFDVVVIGGTNLDLVVNIEDEGFKAMNLLYSLRNEEFSSQTNRRISPLRAWMCAHASSSLHRFLDLEQIGMKQPLIFHAETPLRKFVAYIDPDDKFRTVDKLSQTDGRTLGGKISQSGGGVARNLADALGKLHISPCLISAVGDEEFGNFVLDQTIPHLSRRGILKSKDSNTGTCMVLCDHTGECLVVVGDMDIHEKITRDHVMKHVGVIAESSLVVLDGNLSAETMEFVLRLCHDKSIPVWFEPTDCFKASKPFLRKGVPLPAFISPNFMEFKRIFETVYPESVVDENKNQIEECIKHGYLLAELIDNIIITLGKKGVLVIRKGGEEDPFFKGKQIYKKGRISHRLYKPNCIGTDEIVNVSGAGDCFASGFIAAMLRGEAEKRCIESGFRCSTASLKCSDAVPKRF